MNYESLDEALRPLDPGSLQSVIFSNPIPSKTKYRKIRAERNGSDFFVSSFTVTQVFHETVPADRILAFCLETASDTYRQLNLWLSDGRVMEILLSKKGKAHVSTTAAVQAPALVRSKVLPNRQKNHILQEGMIVPPLVDMGVMTPEGKIILFQRLYDHAADPFSLMRRMHKDGEQTAFILPAPVGADRTASDDVCRLLDDIKVRPGSSLQNVFGRLRFYELLHQFHGVIPDI